MREAENILMQAEKEGNASVSILDESIFTGEQKVHKLYCSIDREFISVAAVDAAQNRFTGFEGFHFPKPLGDEQLATKISELTHRSTILQKVDFRNVSVQVSDARFTFVPSALFKPGDAESYFNFNHAPQPEDAVCTEVIRGFDCVNIFAVPVPIQAALKKMFEQFSVHHHLGSLLEAARISAQVRPDKTLFVHVHSSAVDVIVLEERKLLLANSFSFRRAEDGVYYILMVCEQLSLNPEKITMILSGEIEKDALLSIQLHKYIRNISYGERIKAVSFTYGFDELPPHFYHAAFSQILCES